MAADSIYDRGVVGWYRAFEVTGDLLDRLRIRGVFRYQGRETYRIVRVARASWVLSKRGGVVVLTEIVVDTAMGDERPCSE